MNKLLYVLKNLPAEGKRLEGGLALRITRGNGMTVLGCSRVDEPPSEIEMETVLKAVVELWQPSHVWRGHVSILQDNAGQHHIWRLYWPMELLEMVYSDPVEELFPF